MLNRSFGGKKVRYDMRAMGVCLMLLLAWQSAWGEAPPPSVLHVASERHTSLALNYAYFPQFARLGFGTPDAPWHSWQRKPAGSTPTD